jgi:hypothetical protein
VAARHADIVGIDFYPRHALVSIGRRTLYLAGSRSPWQPRWHRSGRRVMIAEGQAEPWETVTTPPNPDGEAMYSCRPEDLIENYNQCLRSDPTVWAYLFWGAEYWLLRHHTGDGSYLGAFDRILSDS